MSTAQYSFYDYFIDYDVSLVNYVLNFEDCIVENDDEKRHKKYNLVRHRVKKIYKSLYIWNTQFMEDITTLLTANFNPFSTDSDLQMYIILVMVPKKTFYEIIQTGRYCVTADFVSLTLQDSFKQILFKCDHKHHTCCW